MFVRFIFWFVFEFYNAKVVKKISIIKHPGAFFLRKRFHKCKMEYYKKGHKKRLNPVTKIQSHKEVVPPGIEPGTQGFSVLCSTN